MQKSDLVYLLASFSDTMHLERAARSLALPANRMTIIANDAPGATEFAKSLGASGKLDDDVELGEGQRERLEWHLENDNRPLLAVKVPAEEGREVRLQLTQFGGEMLSASDVAEQVGDSDIDPGMISDKPPLPGSDELAFKRR